MSYVICRFNIAVPIAIHTMYDFIVIFITWLSASSDLAQRVRLSEEQLIVAADTDQLGENLPKEFAIVARGVFDILDAGEEMPCKCIKMHTAYKCIQHTNAYSIQMHTNASNNSNHLTLLHYSFNAYCNSSNHVSIITLYTIITLS
jgi:hypothetical protein